MTVAILSAAGSFKNFDAVVRENVDWLFGGWGDQGIGSSDIGACMRNIARDLALDFDALDTESRMMLRTSVSLALNELA